MSNSYDWENKKKIYKKVHLRKEVVSQKVAKKMFAT